MDRSLDEIIGERPRGGRGGGRGRGRRPEDRRPPPPRGPRREEYPRDGINKQNRRDDRANIDTDWVHDRFVEDDRYDRRRDSPEYGDRREAPRGGGRRDFPAEDGTKLRVDNLHYELTEDEVTELFARIGPLASSRLLYDRRDRSQGVALITYHDSRDARAAIREYDGANANGQPIRITLVPSAPSKPAGGSLFDRVESRSLFERIDSGRGNGRDDRRGGRGRSFSPRRDRGEGERPFPRRGSPRSRGGPRERGRRPGARREESGREGRKPRTDENGRPLVGGRPKKTAEELDAEMADYFNASEPATGNNTAEQTTTTTAATGNGGTGDNDIDMIS